MEKHLVERGRENNCFPVEEGLGKLWVSQSQKGGQRNSLIGYAGWGQMAKLANQLIRGLAMKTRPFQSAGVAKLVDAPGLGPGLARGGGSSPLPSTLNGTWSRKRWRFESSPAQLRSDVTQ